MAKTPNPEPSGREIDPKAPSSPSSGLPAPVTTETPTTEKRRRGAPRGSRGCIRHGLMAGNLPAGCKYVEVRLNVFRRKLEDAVLQVKKEITMLDAALINTAVRWERHATLAHRWLTRQWDELKPADRLNFSREISRASSERDKSIRLLELDVNPVQSVWDEIDAEIADGR